METEKLRAADMDPSLISALEGFIRSLGLELFGYTRGEVIARYQPYYDARPPESRSAFETGSAREKCDLTGSFISIAFPYARELTWPKDAHFSVYARGRDYHLILRAYLDRICEFIRGLGYEASAWTDSNALPERLIAVLAGVGFSGRNSLLITRAYGSYVFLGEIRTDLPLPANEDYIEPGTFGPCGSCRNCIRACPAQILGDDYVHADHCLSALTQQKSLSRDELLRLSGRLFGCDTCQRVCPFNRDKAGRGLAEFEPFEHMAAPDLSELLQMSKGVFREKYAITSAGWRGKAILARNALAALASRGDLPEVIRAGSPLVQEAYDKLKR